MIMMHVRHIPGNNSTYPSFAARKRDWLHLQGICSTTGMLWVGDCLRGTNCPLGTATDCMGSRNNALSSAWPGNAGGSHAQDKSQTLGLEG